MSGSPEVPHPATPVNGTATSATRTVATRMAPTLGRGPSRAGYTGRRGPVLDQPERELLLVHRGGRAGRQRAARSGEVGSRGPHRVGGDGGRGRALVVRHRQRGVPPH